MVISRQPPPGADSILAACACLKLFSYKVLQVNGETGLWLEAVDERQAEPDTGTVQAAPQPAPAIVPDTQPVRAADTLPSLSDEEKLYFRQL